MAKLTKQQIAAHTKAEEMLASGRPLDDDQRQFILDNWQESARHINSAAGAFFTPSELACEAATWAVWYRETPPRVLDLCAGIGALGLACHWRSDGKAKVTCVELNPDYVAVGKRLFPEANWICADANSLPADLGQFDVVISNPPFGRAAKIRGPRYAGESELAVVDIASDLAPDGVFILPQGSLPEVFSGPRGHRLQQVGKFDRFTVATGLGFGDDGLSLSSSDCDYYADQWRRGVRPAVDIVLADFEEIRAARHLRARAA